MVNSDTMGGSRTDSENDEEGYISSVCLVVKTRQRDIVRTLSTHELQSAFISYLCVYESSGRLYLKYQSYKKQEIIHDVAKEYRNNIIH